MIIDERQKYENNKVTYQEQKLEQVIRGEQFGNKKRNSKGN